MQIKLQRDRSLVTSPCLRIRTARAEHYLWWHRRPRYLCLRADQGWEIGQ